MKDIRLQAVRDGLAQGRFRVLSVDVFDTLLWRRVPEPADLFLVLGERLAGADKLAPRTSPVAFAELRRAAERAAREKAEAATGYREITLADIYAGLPDDLFTSGFDLSVRIAAEVGCERDLLVADEDILALMAAAKTAGAKVILVSDTYFKADELRELLVAAGFDPAMIDRLYVSCEAGRPKYRDLFDTVLADLAVAGADMVHVGDNHAADIAPAAARKIVTVHYDKWAAVSRVRDVEFPRALAARAELLGTHGDFGLTGLRARLWHRAPAELPAELQPYWRIGASVLAPVFAGFARWIAGACAKSGTPRIFGIMREGRFLGRLVEAAARDLGINLVAEEIWLSRRAVIGAALYPDDLSMLTDLIVVAPGETPDEIFASIGLTRDDVNAVLPQFDMRQPGALNALSQAIAATAALREKVLAASARARRNLMKGLEQHFDLAASQTVVLTDLGYAATIQTVLARILAREGAKLRLEGLYFALNDRALLNCQSGSTVHAFINGRGFGAAVARLLTRTPDVLEHACMCREGSLAGYKDDGTPRHLSNQRDETQLMQMETLQAGVLEGAHAVNRLLGGLAATPYDSGTLQAQIARIVEGLLLHPTAEEADTIGAWQHEANFDLTDRRRLTDLVFDPAMLEYRGFTALGDIGRHNTYWPAAAFEKVNPFLARVFAAAAEGVYTPEALTSGPLLGGLTITPDLGAGFDPRRAGTVALALNAFGRGEIAAVIKSFGADIFTRLKFTWPAAQAVIAVAPPVVVCRGERENRLLAIRGLEWIGTREIQQGIQLTAGTAAETLVDLGDAPPFAHALDLTLRFKYLRLTPIFGQR